MVPINISCHDLQYNNFPNIEPNNLTVTNKYVYYILLNANNCLCYLHKCIFVSKHTMYVLVQANRFRQNLYLHIFYTMYIPTYKTKIASRPQTSFRY